MILCAPADSACCNGENDPQSFQSSHVLCFCSLATVAESTWVAGSPILMPKSTSRTAATKLSLLMAAVALLALTGVLGVVTVVLAALFFYLWCTLSVPEKHMQVQRMPTTNGSHRMIMAVART